MYMIEALRQLLMQVRDDKSGVTTVEYAIMLVLVALSFVVFLRVLPNAVTSVFSRMIIALNS